MGYFTETMALFEFKSDIAREISMKRELDKDYRHDKAFNDRQRGAVNNYARSVEGKTRTMDDYRRRNQANNDIVNLNDASERTRNLARDGKPNRHQRKSCKESFDEAFDSVIL